MAASAREMFTMSLPDLQREHCSTSLAPQALSHVEPRAPPQESNDPGSRALKARVSSVMVLNPKQPLAENQRPPMMERMTVSPVNRAFSAIFLAFHEPWGDAPGCK
jgi:hypothetical protein